MAFVPGFGEKVGCVELNYNLLYQQTGGTRGKGGGGGYKEKTRAIQQRAYHIFGHDYLRTRNARWTCA